ncbi:uncharacterized protein LOC110184533 [Drosophila serrata]|uniref:uncharacterized protein LOC110184533 n=1 Tax=Drosophila serrata TaxID=7274 RepID=UPI000A1D1011|nr:uncharacterized protein LOC110184533 [Drosophila serrata]XP_020808768.1 uncharacterized protein LOC110184533 [Drosophila serrata]XP_020808769.1 uncharacterized protein LOC110184533 [Drosophila serrata]KAH8363749.1 hypothetical protein KR200_010199 [Drosophila serrata]
MGSGIAVQLARKYGAVIFFPTVAVGSIYADWSHTREWKRQQLQLARSAQLRSQS